MAGLAATNAHAAWTTTGPLALTANAASAVTLVREPGRGSGTTDTTELWLMSTGDAELLHPEVVATKDNVAALPVFPRGEGSGELIIYDNDTRTTNAVAWLSGSRDEDEPRWIPRLEITSPEDLPISLANQKVTATLTLMGGKGEMPPAAHISATDSRGRKVLARNFSTFELLAGEQTIVFPAAGYYDVSLKLMSDDVTSFPRSQHRENIPVPFGQTLNDIGLPPNLPDGVSTDTIIGTVVTLEELPTTASVVAEDRLQYVVFGKHSREIQKNRWPFGISGANLMEIPVREHDSLGSLLLLWQRRLGSSFAPIELEWADIQTRAGRFSYAQINSTLRTHRRRMVRPVVTLVGRSAWNNELPTETTETLKAWIRFTGILSEKFTPLMWGLKVWDNPKETWPDPKGYAEAIQAALEGFTTRDGEPVPTPPVIVGGTIGVDSDYLKNSLTTETAQRVSLSFHFRPSDVKKPPTKTGLEQQIDEALNVLKAHDAPDRPIYISSIRYPNGPAGVTKDLQANYLVRAYVVAMSKDVYKVMWDTLFDRSDIPWAADPAHRTGLLDSELKPKPSGVAYNILSFMTSGATPDGVTTQGSASIYKFNLPLQDNKWPGSVYVAWTESPDQVQDIRLKMTHGGGVYALDYLGAEVHARKVAEDSANSIEGSYQIPVGFEPVFIWDAGRPGFRD